MVTITVAGIPPAWEKSNTFEAADLAADYFLVGG
jgi:hypothetical protein